MWSAAGRCADLKIQCHNIYIGGESDWLCGCKIVSQELQEYNASGGYSVEVPWHVAKNRELAPAEVVNVMITGALESTYEHEVRQPRLGDLGPGLNEVQ